MKFGDKVRYKSGYKYQLFLNFVINLGVTFSERVETDFIILDTDGTLTIIRWYAWDGASGPTIDTKNTIRGSLVHDALYQLIRLGHLPPEFKDTADLIFYNILRDDGMTWVRAKIWYRGVQKGGNPSIDPRNEKSILVAP